MSDLFSPPPAAITKRLRLTFDGGAKGPNLPPGLGNGYGSYQFEGEPIVRVDHEAVMTANCAEVLTLCCALEAMAARHDPATLAIHVEGDSQVALAKLKAARGVQRFNRKGNVRRRLNPKGSDCYKAACERLNEAAAPFGEFTARWKSRDNSVALFGH